MSFFSNSAGQVIPVSAGASDLLPARAAASVLTLILLRHLSGTKGYPDLRSVTGVFSDLGR